MAAPWTPHEFEQLLRLHSLSDANVAAQLRSRTAGAVDAERAAIHKYHTVGNEGTFRLAHWKVDFIEARRGQWICHACRAPF